MKPLIIISFIFATISHVCAQDLYNPDLIKKLKVKSQKVISSGSSNDTTEYKYDLEGRLIYQKGKQYGSIFIDSIYYPKHQTIKKNYSDKGLLQSTETNTLDKKGNIIRHERNQLLPIVNNNGYETIYKKGKAISTKGFNDGKITYTWDESMKISSDSIQNYDNDTTYSYILNHHEVLWFKEEGNNKDLGYLAFDDDGRIVASGNYVHNKPNQVSVFVRHYNLDSKTYSEEVHTEYFFENGLSKQSNYGDLITNHYYEFY